MQTENAVELEARRAQWIGADDITVPYPEPMLSEAVPESDIAEAARRIWVDGDLQIDDEPAIIRAEGGAWVAARVWVASEDIGGAE